MNKISRRQFLKTGLGTAATFMIVPNSVLGMQFGHKAPSDKLNIAGIGIGGMGRNNLRNMSTENIYALCDVDWHYAEKAFNDYPKALRFKDWRKMFDEVGKNIDAVLVATPDHNHAVIAATAMTLGKHVYVQKPLTHSVYEARLLAKLAKKYKVATQMGNQGNSWDSTRLCCEWIWDDAIGEVTSVDCWTNRPIWPQGMMAPTNEEPVPSTLDWDLFLGPAKKIPYNHVYHPWNWRGWWAFGTGALGDMACHIMDCVVMSLGLKYPTSVMASSTLVNDFSAPQAQFVTYTFPARARKGKVNMPEVKVRWYDGGFMPERPKELADGEMMGDWNGGVLFHGTKGKIMTGCYGMNPVLLPKSRMKDYPTPKPVLRRVPGGDADISVTKAHEQDWIRACKEDPDSRVETSSNFQFSGPLTEMVDMGVLAVRLQTLNRELLWDGENMKFTNIGPNDKVSQVKRDDFEVVDGDPKFDRNYVQYNALEFANELIKHTYHNGFTLPPMPI